MDNATAVSLAQNYLLSNYRQAPICLVRGEGSVVFDADGHRFLDLYAGIAVSALGHAHPKLQQAIQEQAANILHTSNLVFNEPSLRLAKALVQKSITPPGDEPTLHRVFLCNSGTEAMEACIKLARRKAFLEKETQRSRFIAFNNAFHGRTMGALALTGTPKYWEGFSVDTHTVTHLPYGDADAVENAMLENPGQYAAIVVEPVQGEGGVLPAPEGFLKRLRNLATTHNALLIFDEIQTGIGRTGKFFSFQHFDVIPDMMALAKGLAGGVPIGAMMVREELNHVLSAGSHGTTFGGNALACAAALAVVETLDAEGILNQVPTTALYLSKQLAALAEKHPQVFERERGLGLLRGLVMREGVEARSMLIAAREHGVLLSVASERVLRFSPPLNIESAIIDEAMERLDQAAATLKR